MMKLKKMIVLLCAFTLVGLLSGCEEQGPAEEAGEKIDKAIESTRESMEETGQKLEEQMEKAGEKIEETGEKIQEKAN